MSGLRKIAFLFACLFLAFGTVDGIAGEVEVQNTVTVLDEAGILMEEEADWLKSVAQGFSDRSGFGIVAATCQDAGGKTARDICEENFNKYAGTKDGISCLVDLDNRELYLATAGKAVEYLTDSRLDQILEDAYAAAKKEDYTQALYLMLYESEQAYIKGVPENIQIADEENIGSVMGRLAAIAIAIAAGGCMIRSRVKRRSPGGMGQSVYRRRYHRRPPAAFKSSRPVNRSSVHTGAGGRRFGGRGRKF